MEPTNKKKDKKEIMNGMKKTPIIINTTATASGSNINKKQKRLGPAPIASFEDISDEVRQKIESGSSPESRLPEILEYQPSSQTTTPVTQTITTNTTPICSPTLLSGCPSTLTTTIQGASASGMSLGIHTPSTPRIDISRASSSSHHDDSRDSSPENVFEQVGTGILTQEAGILGFKEDGALDLRSSTEELYFMEKENTTNNETTGKCSSEHSDKITNMTNLHNQQQQQQQQHHQCRSPVMFRFDDQQAACLQQNQRKDSASSEVAALLCISGRTSRISSVGSQGSAMSRLSAMSGVSRSPSPHRMLLETSFCGPKPVDDVRDVGTTSGCGIESPEALEQIILARKKDPTQAVIAEGVHIDTSASPAKKNLNKSEDKRTANGGVREVTDTSRRKLINDTASGKPNEFSNNPEVKITKPTTARIGIRKTTAKKDTKPIVGITPSGTEYIRINLKPDHMYGDHGVGANERIIEASFADSSIKKPGSLSLTKDSVKVMNNQQLLSSSPKSTKHIIVNKDVALGGSRSPSPATVTVSRKSSFCSLFKSKETVASPESPTVNNSQQQQPRKKSGISVLLRDPQESPRDRSRSRSKSRDRTPQSATSTPSKQKSVLAIFKPKRSGSKSKSTSPVESEHPSSSSSGFDGLSQVEFRFNASTTPDSINGESRPGRTRTRLRYYDTPLDGKSIHIPLHTPPDEKDSDFRTKVAKPQIGEAEADVPIVLKSLTPQKPTPSPTASFNAMPVSIQSQRMHADPPKSILPKIQTTQKVYRIENPDGSITIPLHSPQDEHMTTNGETGTDSSGGAGIGCEGDSMWSIEVQRHSSQESQETVISSSQQMACYSDASDSGPTSKTIGKRKSSRPSLTDTVQIQPAQENGNMLSMIATPGPPPPTPATAKIPDKKHILFCTRIGSGSEEQIFSTQLSLSKTESLSSQLSEQTAALDSPTGMETRIDVFSLNRSETTLNKKEEPEQVAPPPPVVVVMRRKDQSISIDEDKKRRSKSSSHSGESADDLINSRHSRYIENIDEIMATQQKLQTERDQTRQAHHTQKQLKSEKSLEPTITSSTLPATSLSFSTTSDRHSFVSTDGDRAGSSESERDCEGPEKGPQSSSAPKSNIPEKRHPVRLVIASTIEDHESAGLVSQDSFDDELPYVPTTLPEERAVGVAIIPIKERVNMELKMYPVERPRSTTPINPACLEDYCGTALHSITDDNDNIPLVSRGEKLKISLPRRDSRERGLGQKAKSPRRVSQTSGKSWFEFAEQGIKGGGGGDIGNAIRRNSNQEQSNTESPLNSSSPPPPLPPRKPQTASQWINFENIPEKRKQPKRITTLPMKDHSHGQDHHDHRDTTPGGTNTHFNYVNPEECQCECHEIERAPPVSIVSHLEADKLPTPAEDTQPLLDSETCDIIDRTSISDSSMECSEIIENSSSVTTILNIDGMNTSSSSSTVINSNQISNINNSEQKPFSTDLSIGGNIDESVTGDNDNSANGSASNRSSLLSQEESCISLQIESNSINNDRHNIPDELNK